MVEFQVPENIQLYFVCPRFGYVLGDYVRELHGDEDSLKADLERLQEGLHDEYGSSPNMLALNAAWENFMVEKTKIDEGLGSCQPMSDTIELATAQVCDEVILGMQMMTAISFGLSCLLMYGTLHKWFGSALHRGPSTRKTLRFRQIGLDRRFRRCRFWLQRLRV